MKAKDWEKKLPVCSDHFIKLAACSFVHVTLHTIYVTYINNVTLQTL